MTKRTKSDPQDKAEAGKGFTPYQKARLARVIRGIGKQPMSDYRGAASYQLLPGDE